MEHSKHIIRAVILLIGAAVVFVVARNGLIPDTFGQHGHYRFASVAEFTERAPVHGGGGECGSCHEDESETHTAGSHGAVSCEVCHAPLGRHVVSGDWAAEMPVRRDARLCAWCHERLAARPKTFPQIVTTDHVIEKGEEMSAGVCLECHNAHDPSEAS